MACISQIMPEVKESRLRARLRARFYRRLNRERTSVKFHDFVRSHIFVGFQHITISNVTTALTGCK